MSNDHLQSTGQFDVDSKHVVNLMSSLLDVKLSKLSNDISPTKCTDSELDTIVAKYESFLRECNAVDMADVYTAVTSACSDYLELAEVINRTSFLIVNPLLHCQFEVSAYNICIYTLFHHKC